MAKAARNRSSSNWRRRLKTFWRKHVRRTWRDYHWVLIGGVWLIALYLGYIGLAKFFAALGEMRSPSDILYLDLQLFVLESGSASGPKGWELETARLLAPAVAAYTALQALAVILHERIQSLRLRFIRNHIVVSGLGRKGFLLVTGLLDRGDRVVAIEQDEHNLFVEQCREQGAIVLIGNAANPELLRKAGVHRASHVVSLCGDDGVNAEVAVRTRELVGKQREEALTCFVHIVNPRLCNLLREQEIAAEADTPFRLEFFNVFDNGARVLLKEHPAFSEKEEHDSCPPHVVVVGVGRMGESLVVQAARSWWSSRSATGERLRITVVDKEAERKVESLRLRYPQLSRACDVITRQIDIHWPEFERGEFLFGSDGRCDITTVYVCLDNDSMGLAAGLALLQQVRQHRPIPVVVRMVHDAGLATLLRGSEVCTGDASVLHAFGLLDRTCRPDLLLGGSHETIARAIHEEYLQQQEQAGETPDTNPSMSPWDELPDKLKESNRLQADHVGVKLRAIGCGIEPLADWDAERLEFSRKEVELMAEMEHQRFVEERRRSGWTYSPKPKHMERKTSPTLAPWDDLPEDEKDKDRNTVKSLPVFLARAGFQIYRFKDRSVEDLGQPSLQSTIGVVRDESVSVSERQ